MRALPVLLLLGCGASSSSSSSSGPPPVSKPAGGPALAVAGCDRSGPAPAGGRRFELKLETSPGAAEITVDGSPALMTASAGGACAQLGLAPGAHRVAVHGHDGNGVGLSLAVAEAHPTRGDWYDVFSFKCGVPGVCQREELNAWKEMAKDRKRIWDPCSATQLRDMKWDSERLSGTSQVSSVELGFTIFVYEQPFDLAPRDPSCPEQ